MRPFLRRFSFCCLAALAIGVSSVHAQKPPAKGASKAAPVIPTLAHNLDEVNEVRLLAVVQRYEQETGQKIQLVRLAQGDTPATLNLLSRHQTTDVLSQPKNFVPLHSMMQGAGQPLKVSLSEILKPGVTDARGRLVALPVLYSTPVLFYNKNALRKAGLDPEAPPRTWFEMQGYLDRLQSAGYACPYTSSWPVWVHIDNVSAVSGLPASDVTGQLKFNGFPQVKHVAMMATWTKALYFRQFGHGNEASQRFRDGECAMITTDSREHADFQDARGVELGVAPLPYHDDVYGGRRPALADGPALWVGAGKPAAEYRAAARFVNFLLSPEIQIELVRSHGGLPLTEAARLAAVSRLLQDGRQALDAAYASLQGKGQPMGPRVNNIDRARMIASQELEDVWNDRKPAKLGLDTAVSLGNSILSAQPALKRTQPF